MKHLLSRLDNILRGETTHPEALREGRIDVPVGGLVFLIVLLAMLYGLCMGSFSLLKEIPPDIDITDRYWQIFATTVKVPALFFLTLVVTFPSLYVFNALVGSRLTVVSVLRLLIVSLSVNLAVLASLGPIVLFFSLSTKSYAFVKLLNVAAFTIAGVLGLVFLLQTLHRLTRSTLFDSPGDLAKKPAGAPDNSGSDSGENSPDASAEQPSDATESVEVDEEPSALEMPTGQVLGHHTRLVFGTWVCVFALVGAQMGWVLRPFIGSPTMPFTWFRERQSNFFEAVLNAFRALFTGG